MTVTRDRIFRRSRDSSWFFRRSAAKGRAALYSAVTGQRDARLSHDRGIPLELCEPLHGERPCPTQESSARYH